MKIKLYLILLFISIVSGLKAQYIYEVLEYKPAPGQFINSSPWGVPSSANSIINGVTGSMSLGSFGGYVVFKFENPVENHPDNPYGIDFTIFGNPLEEWAEHGIVSVMKDDNGNGLPDDTWYELAGSEYFFSSTIRQYEVTYNNPDQDTAANIPWTDNMGNSGLVIANAFHNQPYYPFNDSFPAVGSDNYTLSGTKVVSEVDRSNPSYIKSYRKAFGYADNQLRGSEPYTMPDNPYTPEKENSGGDAFDIDWAIDENGDYVDLDVIHFVKVHNAVLADAGWLGEVSTEITGAVDVSPDNTVTGILDVILIDDLPDTIRGDSFQIEAFAYHKGRVVWDEEIDWEADLNGVDVNDSNMLHFTSSGKLTLSATLSSNEEISAEDSTVLVYINSSGQTPDNNLPGKQIMEIMVYPNPAYDNIFIKGISNARITVYDITGKEVLITNKYTSSRAVSVKHLPEGIYLVKIQEAHTVKTIRFLKH